MLRPLDCLCQSSNLSFIMRAHIKTRSIGAGREMCESSKARRPDTEWVPGALLPAVAGRATESAALHPYPIGRTCPAMDFFHPARPSPCESFRAANWQMRRRVPSAGVPTAVLPRGAFYSGAFLPGINLRAKARVR